MICPFFSFCLLLVLVAGEGGMRVLLMKAAENGFNWWPGFCSVLRPFQARNVI